MRYEITHLPGHIAQWVVHLTEEPKVPGSVPGLAHTFVEIDQEIISSVIFNSSLIQEGQVSVTG